MRRPSNKKQLVMCEMDWRKREKKKKTSANTRKVFVNFCQSFRPAVPVDRVRVFVKGPPQYTISIIIII